MATIEFIDQETTIETDWLNAVDAVVYDILSGATTIAEAKTALSLTIGTDVQAYDDDLTALAGLTSAANKVPYFTGSATAGLLDFLDEDTMSSDSATAVASQQSIKAYATSLVDDLSGVTDAATARTNLSVYSSSEVDAGFLALSGGTLTGNLTLSSASSPKMSATDTTNTVTTILQSGDDAGYIGTTTNHPLRIYSGGSVSATFDATGNVGIGVVPSAWGANYPALQLADNVGMFGSVVDNSMGILNNAYFDGTNDKYLNDGYASEINQTNSGTIVFYTAGSGTAGDTVSWTTGPTFNNDGSATIPSLTITDDLTVDADASGSGSVFGGATGGTQGAGTINAQGLYVNGTSVSLGAGTLALDQTSTFSGVSSFTISSLDADSYFYKIVVAVTGFSVSTDTSGNIYAYVNAISSSGNYRNNAVGVDYTGAALTVSASDYNIAPWNRGSTGFTPTGRLVLEIGAELPLPPSGYTNAEHIKFDWLQTTSSSGASNFIRDSRSGWLFEALGGSSKTTSITIGIDGGRTISGTYWVYRYPKA